MYFTRRCEGTSKNPSANSLADSSRTPRRTRRRVHCTRTRRRSRRPDWGPQKIFGSLPPLVHGRYDHREPWGKRWRIARLRKRTAATPPRATGRSHVPSVDSSSDLGLPLSSTSAVKNVTIPQCSFSLTLTSGGSSCTGVPFNVCGVSAKRVQAHHPHASTRCNLSALSQAGTCCEANAKGKPNGNHTLQAAESHKTQHKRKDDATNNETGCHPTTP